MGIRDRLASFLPELPVAHRIGIGAAGVGLVMLFVVFVQWVTTPSYTVLYTGLADEEVASAISELETLGVPYELTSGGSTVMVPRDELYTTRASLAGAGVAGAAQPQGYELLDGQGLSVSDFRQRVDFRRALEGELSQTLAAMDGIAQAGVHLVTPEQQVFTDQQQPATASVLLTTTRPLGAAEVDAVSFLVASSVEGLQPDQITIADVDGTVLHTPGDTAGGTQLASRQLRQTREFEQLLASDITALLQQATGSTASVVVRAGLDFDESETSTETFDPESAVALREQLQNEEYTGSGAPQVGGTVGADEGTLPVTSDEGEYRREEVSREFGVDRVTTRTVRAPGNVERLSVAIVVDDGTVTGAVVPATEELETLVTAAIGLDADRGDEIAVTRVAMPAVEDVEPVPSVGMLDELPKYVAGGVLALAAVALFLMTRQRGGRRAATHELGARPAAALAATPAETAPAEESTAGGEHRREGPALKDEVADLVQAQPEEIATLLRGWLADRRG